METQTDIVEATRTVVQRLFGYAPKLEHSLDEKCHTFRLNVFAIFDADMMRLLDDLEHIYGFKPCMVVYSSRHQNEWGTSLVEVKWYAHNFK